MTERHSADFELFIKSYSGIFLQTAPHKRKPRDNISATMLTAFSEFVDGQCRSAVNNEAGLGRCSIGRKHCKPPVYTQLAGVAITDRDAGMRGQHLGDLRVQTKQAAAFVC